MKNKVGCARRRRGGIQTPTVGAAKLSITATLRGRGWHNDEKSGWRRVSIVMAPSSASQSPPPWENWGHGSVGHPLVGTPAKGCKTRKESEVQSAALCGSDPCGGHALHHSTDIPAASAAPARFQVGRSTAYCYASLTRATRLTIVSGWAGGDTRCVRNIIAVVVSQKSLPAESCGLLANGSII